MLYEHAFAEELADCGKVEAWRERTLIAGSCKSGRVYCDGMSGDSRGLSTFVYPVYACVSGV